MTQPIKVSLRSEPGAGKTTLLAFLIEKLVEIDAIKLSPADCNDTLSYIMRNRKEMNILAECMNAEEMLLDIDREKVRAALSKDGMDKTIVLNSDIDDKIFSRSFLSGNAQMMIDAIDDEIIDECDTLQLTINRKGA